MVGPLLPAGIEARELRRGGGMGGWGMRAWPDAPDLGRSEGERSLFGGKDRGQCLAQGRRRARQRELPDGEQGAQRQGRRHPGHPAAHHRGGRGDRLHPQRAGPQPAVTQLADARGDHRRLQQLDAGAVPRRHRARGTPARPQRDPQQPGSRRLRLRALPARADGTPSRRHHHERPRDRGGRGGRTAAARRAAPASACTTSPAAGSRPSPSRPRTARRSRSATCSRSATAGSPR